MTAGAHSGLLLVVSAPSGAGKTSLVGALVDTDPRLCISVSHTTRARRAGEAEGRHYHFVSSEAFEALAAEGGFLEHAEVFGNLYGTARAHVAALLARDRDVVLEIDWQGAQQVRTTFPGAITVFVLPPSRQALAERLAGRGQDSELVIEERLEKAAEEMSHYHEFDYVLVNDDFARALGDLRAIVTAERLRQCHQQQRLLELVDALLS